MSSSNVALQSVNAGRIFEVTAMKFSNQMGEKRRRRLRRRSSDLRIKVFRNLFDGEEHRQEHTENVVAEDDINGGDFKAVGPLQVDAGYRRAQGGRADLAETSALQTSTQRRTAELGHQMSESVKAVVEREAGAPAVGENDRFVVLSENARAGFLGPIRASDVELAGLPLGDRLATDAIPLGERSVFLLAQLDLSTDPWRRRRTGMCLSLCRSASFSRHLHLPRIEPSTHHHAPKALTRFVVQTGRLRATSSRMPAHLRAARFAGR